MSKKYPKLVTTQLGELPLELSAAGITSITSITAELRDWRGQPVWQATADVQGTSATLRPILPRFGTYWLTATPLDGSSTTPHELTVAAIPNNSHDDISTTSPFGMGCYFAMRFTPDELQVVADLASLSGVACSREELRWDLCEPQRGKWEWTSFDYGVRACLNHHIGILGLLDYWGSYHDERATVTQEALNDFGRYVATAIDHYKPHSNSAGISDWEIWNEPATFWFHSADDYGLLTSTAYKSAKMIDKYCRVYFANADEVFDRAAIQAMHAAAFDGITPHFYCPPRSPKDGDLAEMMAKQRKFFLRQGLSLPLWISEMGWHSDASREKQTLQAAYLVQSYVLALAAGYDRVFWYNFVSDSADKNAAEFGMLNRTDLSPRIAYAAFAGMVHALEPFQKTPRPVELGRNVKAYIFPPGGGDAGHEVAVLWSENESGSLDFAAPETCEVYDAFGNLLSDERATSIPLETMPHYVRASRGGMDALLSMAHLEGIPQVELSLQPTTGSLTAGTQLRITTRNYNPEPLDAAIALNSASIRFAEADLHMHIPADGVSTTTATIRERWPCQNNSYPLSVQLRLADGTTMSREWRLCEKAAVRGTPKIDGDLSDWADALPLRLDSAGQAVGINPWMDWNLSATYFLKWDDDNLYFAARVHDNMHANDRTGRDIWEGDSWQLGFQAPADTHTTNPAAYCYGLALTSRGVEAVAWEGGKDAHRIRAAIKTASPQLANSPGGPESVQDLLYECAIPLELLEPLKLKRGSTFRFSVLLNDNDGGGRTGWMESTPGIGTGFEPSRFDLFELK